MIDYISIGRQIKKNRLRANMTQETLAEKVSVTPPYISRIETGSSSPSLQTLVDICNALHITIDDLMQDSFTAMKKKTEGRLDLLLTDCSLSEMNLIADVVDAILRNVRG